MDLKDDEKSWKYREHPHVTSRYFESNAGHLFVNNVNPFNSVGGHASDVKENRNKRQNDEFINIFNNTPTREPNDTPSKTLLNEIMKNCPFNKKMFRNEPYDDMHDARLARNQRTNRPYTQPTASMSANMFDTQYITSSSKSGPKTPLQDHQVRFEEYNEDNNRHRAFSSNETLTSTIIDTHGRAEKTTYCRPLLNMYNQEFVYKTIQRNAKLQKLVRKLVIAREREKQREAWNNYINDLKNKHRYYSNEPSRISPQYVPDEHITPVLIDDFYNTRFSWRQSNPCKNLLQDFYGAHNSIPSAYNRHPYDYDSISPPDSGSYIYDNNRFCYPTSSQAKLLKCNTDRHDNQYAYEWRNRPSGRFFRGNTIVIEKEGKHKGCCFFDKVQGTARPHLLCTHTTKTCTVCKDKVCSVIRSSSIPYQTEKTLPLVNEENDKNANLPHTQAQTQNDDNPETLKNSSNIHLPSNQEFSKENIDFNVPREQESIKQDSKLPQRHGSIEYDRNVTVPHKQDSIEFDKEVNVPNKQPSKGDKKVPHKKETPKPKKNRNFSKIQETYGSEYANVPQKEETTKQDKAVSRKLEDFKDKFEKVTNNINKLKNRIRQSEEDTKLKSLITIEAKLDSLMKSIDAIMIDIKSKKNLFLNKKSTAVSALFITTSRNNLNRRRSDPYGFTKNEEYLRGLVQHSSRSLAISEIGNSDLRRHNELSFTKLDNILLEEMEKSDIVNSDFEGLLNMHTERNCSVQITIDIPTKERSTEVTDSLSKARLASRSNVIVEEITSDAPDERHTPMTIAVNTDPLGLLALLRVSTDTVKQLLSYVPNLNYSNYLSMLQLPSRNCVSHYICNICGAAFGRPSQLSEHIEQHNLGTKRDCCVCRHTLDLQRAHVGLFACRYCGQRFTRAYCCELHQQTCAKQLGRSHDVNSSHILLR